MLAINYKINLKILKIPLAMPNQFYIMEDIKRQRVKVMKKVIYSDSVLLAVEKLKAKNDIVKFSNTSKLGVKAWGLQALNTCPGSTNEKGELVAACSGCYAVGGSYRFNNVRAARLYNQSAWQNEFFVDQFVIKLQNDRFFRWFDSGDMYSIGLA